MKDNLDIALVTLATSFIAAINFIPSCIFKAWVIRNVWNMYAPSMGLVDITITMVVMPVMVVTYAIYKVPGLSDSKTLEEMLPGEIISTAFVNAIMAYVCGLFVLLGAWVLSLVVL